MDGARDRASVRTAETGGRGFGIGAGAATGPSRSVSRQPTFAAGAPAADVIIDLMLRPLPPDAPVTAPPEPVAEAAETSHTSLAPAVSMKPARRNSTGAVVASSLGALAALGLVMAVVLTRPEVDTEPQPSGAATASVIPQAVAEPAAAVTVYLRVASGLGPAERQRIEAALAEAGYGAVVVQEMPFSISRSRVGYFREMDRAAAEALIAALRGTHDGVVLRDYSELIAEPEPGRLDLWIGS